MVKDLLESTIRVTVTLSDEARLRLSCIQSETGLCAEAWLFDEAYYDSDGETPMPLNLTAVQNAVGFDPSHVVVVTACKRTCRLWQSQWLPCAAYGAAQVRQRGATSFPLIPINPPTDSHRTPLIPV